MATSSPATTVASSRSVVITERRVTVFPADATRAEHVVADVRTVEVPDFRDCKRWIRERTVQLGCKGWVLTPVTRVDVAGTLQAPGVRYEVRIEARYAAKKSRLMEPTARQRRYYEAG